MFYLYCWCFVAIAVIGAVLLPDAHAAPTIKKLNSQINNTTLDNATINKQTMAKMSTANKIAPSVSAVVKSDVASNANAVNVVSTSPASDGTRLSGLFHGNIIKGIGTKLSTNYAANSGGQQPNNSATSELSQRINELEEALDAKQEALKSGNGIYIDGKTIGLSQEMVKLPEKLQEINQEIDELHEKFNVTNLEQIQQIIDNIQNNTTIYDSGTQEYRSVTIVDSFDEQDFIDKQQGSVK